MNLILEYIIIGIIEFLLYRVFFKKITKESKLKVPILIKISAIVFVISTWPVLFFMVIEEIARPERNN